MSALTWPKLAALVVALLLLAVAAGTVPPLSAAEGDAPAAEGDKPAEADPLAVPDGSTDELVAFIEKLLKMRPDRSQPNALAQFVRTQESIVEAADKVLAAEPKPEQRLVAVRGKLTALSILAQLRPGNANDDLRKLAESLVDDPDAAIAGEARRVVFAFKARTIGQLGDAEAAQLLDELLAFVRGAGNVDTSHLQLAFVTGQSLEEGGKTDLAAKAYTGFAEVFTASSDPKLANYGKKLEGSGRRVGLVGKPLELTGTLPDGSSFDWASYKGKVVLVDFWATWCGPCRAELPNVREQYERYHDKGFDVVGISLDNNKEALESFLKENELPWVSLFSEDPEATGWDHPMATHYGIMSIPATFLVDQQGNVVTLSARGEQLAAELEKLLGPAEKPADAAEDPKKE